MKAMFAIKLLVTLCIIALIASLAADAMAEVWTVRSVQASGGLNVRCEPSIEARAIYLLEDAETVIVLEWFDTWALVAKNNGAHNPIGWVCGDYLR